MMLHRLEIAFILQPYAAQTAESEIFRPDLDCSISPRCVESADGFHIS
jgi:hypothetical protein